MATNARSETVTNARQLRKAMTPPEARLWVALRGRRLAGLKFRRQHPIGAYVLDFYCPRLRLAVEVDGMDHAIEEQRDRDKHRDQWLRRFGIRVCRIPSWAVRDDLDRVVDYIERVADKVRTSEAVERPDQRRDRRPPSALRATSP
jgi:very-short-patch-repair endonuclease